MNKWQLRDNSSTTYTRIKTFMEHGIRKDILQMRSDAIIGGLRKARQEGFDFANLETIEKQAPLPQEHRDMLLVYLGLKPLAFGLEYIMNLYTVEGVSYLHYLSQEKDTGIRVLFSQYGIVYNPALVKPIAEETQMKSDPENPQEFGLETIDLVTKADDITVGKLADYPESAITDFAQYVYEVPGLYKTLWEIADEKGLKVPNYLPMQIAYFAVPHIKRDFLKLAKKLGVKDKKLLNYVKGLRQANVPGFPYLVSGRESIEEQRLRVYYRQSRMDQKLSRLLQF